MFKLINQLKKILEHQKTSLNSFIKRTIYSLFIPIFLIFNCSPVLSVVPKQWNKSHVIPVYNIGSKNSPLNCRSISLTSRFCRIFERKYLLTYNHITPSNFVFFLIANHFSIVKLFTFVAIIYDYYLNNKSFKAIYTDTEKTFDSV